MIKLTRRSVVLAGVAAPFAARAQSWPSGNIKLVVPYPPGGSTDALARLVQNGLQQRLGATIIIENKSGASGSIGEAVVAKSPPDGNTWLVDFDNHGVNPSLISNLPFDTERDLAPVMLVATAPYLLATHPSRPFKTLQDLIAAAKAKPGVLSYASVGAGSIGHLAMVMLSKQAGVELVHVPYRGGGPALNDAIAGHVDLIIGSVALLMPQVRPGALRPVAQMGKTRISALPEVMTVAETFPNFEATTWWAFFTPTGTPRPYIDRFHADLAAAIREERVTNQLTDSQQMTLVLGGPEQLAKFRSEQIRIWGAVVRENGIKGDI